MGGAGSKQNATAPAPQSTSVMERYDSEEDDCFCSVVPFWNPKSKKISGGTRGGGGYDLGTPIPDTPMDIRRKRAAEVRRNEEERRRLEADMNASDARAQARAHRRAARDRARAAGQGHLARGGERGRAGNGEPGTYKTLGYGLGLEKEKSEGVDVMAAMGKYEDDLINSGDDRNGGGLEALEEEDNEFGWKRQPSAEIHEGKNCERELYQKYNLLEVLGVGSTSTVHRCIERTTGCSHACKVIDKHHIEQRFQGMMQQFHTEIRALRSLHHPNIITLYDVYITDDKIYIIMELMEGGELFDYVVQKGTLNEEEASRIVRKVTSALVYMHSKNIIHRDLKPENLLLTHRPRSSHDIEVKIIDFGLSKCMQEPVARSFLGTRGYLAPEMLQRRDYTRSVDAWALGVIVFVLLCGCLPFDDDSSTVPSDEAVRAKFVLRFPRWAKNLSPSAKDLLAKLLEVDPNIRYSAERALDHPWVRGETASRDALLQSPGRIQLTPGGTRPAGNRPGTGGRGGDTPTRRRREGSSGASVATREHVSRTRADRDRSVSGSAARPTRQLVRKTSI